MKSRILLPSLLPLLFLVFPSTAEDRITELPDDIPYSDENTGVVFPPSLGKFRKAEIRISSNPVLGTRIHYAGSRIACSADVYIYALSEKPRPITPEEFQIHYEKTRQAILNLHTMTRRVEEAESAGKMRYSGRRNRNPALREIFFLRTDGEETYHSELLLILSGDRVTKLRLTVPASQKEAIEEAKRFTAEFCKLFYRGKTPEWKTVAPGKTQGKTK